jgi:phosphoenolpyruvate carboxykinase (GTP)
MARDEGWMAEHMLILKLTSPEGDVKYRHGRVPVGVRQDEPGDADPAIEGWKVETVGDDIAWMKWGKDGRLYAINPEAGFFGVAPNTA